MANLLNKLGPLNPVWSPVTISVRHARRVNVQKPREPHYERARVLELVKPMYPQPLELTLPPSQKCLKNKELEQDRFRVENPYERIVAKEIVNWFNHSRMIAFLHANSISGEDNFQARIKLKRENMHLKVYSHYTLKMALENTIYEPVLKLVRAHTAFVFCEEPKVSTVLKVLKKIPQYILMAGVVEGRLLSLSKMKAYSELKDITEARSQLVATLNSATLLAVSQLTQHQSTLINHLNQHIQNLSSSDKES